MDRISYSRQYFNTACGITKSQFDKGIIFTKYKIWGIKTKEIEEFAKILAKDNIDIDSFEFNSFEEILLAGFVVAYSKISSKEKIVKLEKIFPYMDNWAVTDMIIPRFKNMETEKSYFENLVNENNPFYVRCGIVWLKRFILKKELFAVVNMLKNVKNEDYFVKMAIAWTYQEAFTVDFEFMYSFIQTLDDEFIIKKTISKCCDSFRFTKAQKEKLKELRKQTKYCLQNSKQ